MKKNCVSISVGLRKTLMVLLAAMLLTTGWISLMPDTTTAADEDMYGGILRVAIVDEPSEEIHPLTTHVKGDLDLIDLMYDSLAIMDVETGKMIPWLAESWTTGDNNVTVTLREDIEFWDGSTMTAEDVKYSYENYEGPLMVPVTSVNVDDSHTISFELDSLNPAFFITDGLKVPIVKDGTDDMGSGPFMDLTINEEIGNQVEDEFLRDPQLDEAESSVLNLVFDDVYQVELYGTLQLPENETERESTLENYTEDSEFIADHPVMWEGTYHIKSENYTLDKSTGTITDIYIPYMTEITASYKYNTTFYDLVTNEDYFMERPFIDGVSFQVFKTIVASKGFDSSGVFLGESGSGGSHMAGAINQLENNKIDLIKSYYPRNYVKYVNTINSAIVGVPKNEFVYAGYNAESAPFKVGENDITSEHAEAAKNSINHLFGRTTMVDDTLGGAGFKGITVVSPANEYWFNPDTSAVKQDYVEANDLLDDAAFFDYTGNGFRDLPNEVPFSLGVNYPISLEDENPGSIGSGLAGGGGLGSIWFDAEDNSMSLTNVTAKKDSGDFDITIGRYNGAFDPGMDMYSLFHSDSEENFINLQDSELDAAIEDINGILDQDERQEAMHDMQLLLIEKMPISVIYMPTMNQVYRKDVYTGWLNGFHVGVHNKQNYISVHKMVEDSLTVSITMLASLTSGTNTTITVVAEDGNGDPIPDAVVELKTTLGEFEARTELTDDGGTLVYDYSVPTVTGMTDVVISATVVKGIEMGTGSYVATVHPASTTFTLGVNIDKTQIDSGETAEITVEIYGTMDTYPEITLSILPSTGSAWLEKTSNTGETDQTFTTTFHTEDVMTQTTFRISAFATHGETTQTAEGSLRVNAQPVEDAQTTPMWLYLGMGLAGIIILIILILAMLGKKGSSTTVAPEEDTFEEDEFEEMEEPVEEDIDFEEDEDVFEEDEDAFEEDEDVFEEDEDAFEEDEGIFEEETMDEEPQLSTEQQEKIDKLEKAHDEGKMPTEIYEKNKKKILEG